MKIPDAVIGNISYRRIEDGECDDLLGLFDMQVNLGIDSYLWLKQNGNSVLSRIYLAELLEVQEEYVDRLVQFRKDFGVSADLENLLKKSFDPGELDPKIIETYVETRDARNQFLESRGVSLPH